MPTLSIGTQKLFRAAIVVIAAAIVAVASCAPFPASAACPEGSQFFAYGGAGGCVKPGSSEVVVKCFSMGKVCPTGWSNEGPTDTGSWCCPPVVAPKQNQPVQNETCTWRGMAPFCKGRCQRGEIGRAAIDDSDDPYARAHTDFGADCVTGFKAYCCRLTFPSQ